MKITLRKIRERTLAMRSIRDREKKTPKAIEQAKKINEHNQKMLDKDMEYVKPFVATQPKYLKDFIEHYYFRAWTTEQYATTHSIDPREVESRLKAIERDAEKWHEDC